MLEPLSGHDGTTRAGCTIAAPTVEASAPKVCMYVCDQVPIDRRIKGLKQHSCRNGRRHLQDMLAAGVRRQILHGNALIAHRAGLLEEPRMLRFAP